jgi:protein unc-80
MHSTRRRSNSLPIPQIEVSLYQGSGSRDSPSNSLTAKDCIEVPEPGLNIMLNDSPFSQHKNFVDENVTGNDLKRSSEKKKKVKMADLRALIETKILSKSDRGLEKIGSDNGKQLQHTVKKQKTFLNFY